MELLSSGQQALRKIFQLRVDWGLVISVNVFSFKHGAGDFSSITNYSLKNANSLASHKERNLWSEKISNLLNVVYILIFVDSAFPKRFIAPSVSDVLIFLRTFHVKSYPTPTLPPT